MCLACSWRTQRIQRSAPQTGLPVLSDRLRPTKERAGAVRAGSLLLRPYLKENSAVIAPSDRPDGVGGVIRRQRELAHMSVRQLARVSKVSNAYLSQIERGLHAPSLRVLSAVSEALSVSMEDLLVGRVGTAPVGTAPPPGTQDLTAAIKAEPRLSTSQKEALLAVYRGFLQQGSPPSDHGWPTPCPR